MTLAQQILHRFRGRSGVVAVADEKGFHPERKTISANEIERGHLAQEQSYGFYVLDENNCCWCSCVDLDNKPESPDPRWKEKAEQVYYELQRCSLIPLLEVSQSGNGAHVWLFFSEATPAWCARAWWKAISQKTGIAFKEVFPKQDRLNDGGIGNLVRYPLWNESKFVDPAEGWAEIDPLEAVESISTTSATDLSLLSFQLGMGELTPEPTANVASINVGESDLLPLRVQKLVERGGLLSRRWQRDTAGMKDPSNSAIAMSIAVELVRLYVPTPEITSAVRYWCRSNGAEAKGDRDSWVTTTVTKAYDFVISRQESKSRSSVTTFRDAVDSFITTLAAGQEQYVASGIPEVDQSIDGVAAGEVCIIAARPGHGKTALALQWLDSASGYNIPGLIISEEMSKEQIGKRRLASITALPSEHWGPATMPHLREDNESHHAKRAPVHVVENCNSIDRAEEIIDQYCSLQGVRLVAVDYLQLLTSRTGDRYEVVTEISRRLKQCAARNAISMLLLSQLNREVEKRHDNEPKLSDLRESGQIEQDADLILFGQWPCKFDSTFPKGVYRIYAAKRRNGPIRQSKIEIEFNPDQQRFGIDRTESPL